MQNQYDASYESDSFVVTGQGCTYYFDGPKINTESVEGMYKVVLNGSLHGPACAAVESSPCFQSYWVTTSSTGVFAFVDASGGACPAVLAITNEGSNEEEGTLTVAGIALNRETTWAPQGYYGSYSRSKGTMTLVAQGCAGSYSLVPSAAAPLAFPAVAHPPSPGSATLEFFGAIPDSSSASCPTACAAPGYNAAWDASGIMLNPDFPHPLPPSYPPGLRLTSPVLGPH
jgi:hypothetical protein